MGFFGGDEADDANSQVQQQIRQHQIEIETKRDNLYRERLAIVKGQGAASWTSDALASGISQQRSSPFRTLMSKSVSAI